MARRTLAFAAAILLALCLALPARASITVPTTVRDIQGLSQNATHVIRGVFVRYDRAPTGGRDYGDGKGVDIRDFGADAPLARIAVGAVYAGTQEILNKEIVVVDHPSGLIKEIARGGPVLLFVRRAEKGPQFEAVVHHGFGAFRLVGSDVDLWLEGRPSESKTPLDLVLSTIRALPKARITWSVKVPPVASAAAGSVHLTFTAKNEGTEAVLVLPPSSCFDVVKAYPLDADGLWYPKKQFWAAPEHGLSKTLELPVDLAPGKVRAFEYDVPLEGLKMSAGRDFDLMIWLKSQQLTRETFEATAKLPLRSIWLGGMESQYARVRVDTSVVAAPASAGSADPSPPPAPSVATTAPSRGCAGCTTARGGDARAGYASLAVLVLVLARRRARVTCSTKAIGPSAGNP